MALFSHLLLLASLSAGDAPPDTADIDALARTLRIQIYQTFRADRSEFDRRRQQAQRALDAWHAGGNRPDDRALLVDWYQRAMRASQPGSIGSLPESPRFGTRREWTDPVSDTPSVTPLPPEAPSNPPAIERPSEPPIAPNSEKPRLQISLVELSARLAGYNRGVRAVEIRLGDERVCTAADLTPLVSDLADLARRGRDLSLYRDYVVSESERLTLPTPTVLTDALSLLGDRIFVVRQAASSATYAGDEIDRQAELDRLDALSRQLAEIATLEQTAATHPRAAQP